jgi:hypothetical protein
MNAGWLVGPIPGAMGSSGGRDFLSEMFIGSPERNVQLPRWNQQQQGINSQTLNMALQGLQNPTQGFEPIAQQQMNQFYQQTVPSLAERFTAMGQGGQRGSGFQSALGQAGAGLGTDLAALQAQYGQRQQGLSQGLLGIGMQSPFENVFSLRQPGALQAILPDLLKLLARVGGTYAGIPMGGF